MNAYKNKILYVYLPIFVLFNLINYRNAKFVFQIIRKIYFILFLKVKHGEVYIQAVLSWLTQTRINYHILKE